ncbi:MAG: hypothetical protein KDB16_07160 [Acidimicrobiales bacterium]|nr:hypothetical protein [Acidimicrobiales bacterium]
MVLDTEPAQHHELAPDPRIRRGVVAAIILTAALVLWAVAAGSSHESGADAPTPTTTVSTTTFPSQPGAEPSLAAPAPETSIADAAVDDGPGAANSSAPVNAELAATGSPELLAEHPTNSIVVLWTFEQTEVAVVNLDDGAAATLDLTTFGIDSVKTLVGMATGFGVETRTGVSWFDPVSGSFAELTRGGSVLAWGDDEVWISGPYNQARSFTPLRVGLQGDITELSTVPAGAGPFGFVGDDLLVGAGQAGGVYRSTGDSYQRISDGALVAWGTDGVVVRVCGQTLECNLERIDLGTGATTSYEVAEGLDLGGLWWVDRPTSPELDAHLAISSGAGSPVIYEVGERTVTELPITSARSVAWSAANQWLLIGGANELLAFHRPTSTITRFETNLGLDLRSTMQVAVTPAA